MMGDDEGLEQYADVASCRECGSAWFTLEPCSLPDCSCDRVLGAVAVDGLGRVIAHHGQIVCEECGADIELPQFEQQADPPTMLRLIKGEE
jgi:hypothetical protein